MAIHHRRIWFVRAIPFLLLAVQLLSCSDSGTPTIPIDTPTGEVPDFTLVDVNTSSSTYQDSVSFSDYDGHIGLVLFVSAG